MLNLFQHPGRRRLAAGRLASGASPPRQHGLDCSREGTKARRRDVETRRASLYVVPSRLCAFPLKTGGEAPGEPAQDSVPQPDIRTALNCSGASSARRKGRIRSWYIAKFLMPGTTLCGKTETS